MALTGFIANQLISDTFSHPEATTGLVDGDWTKKVYRNGVYDATASAAVVVTEIADGQYYYTFTPTNHGLWYIAVTETGSDPLVKIKETYRVSPILYASGTIDANYLRYTESSDLSGFGAWELWGKRLKVLDGPAAGEEVWCMYNDTVAPLLTHFPQFSETPEIGDTFEIYDTTNEQSPLNALLIKNKNVLNQDPSYGHVFRHASNWSDVVRGDILMFVSGSATGKFFRISGFASQLGNVTYFCEDGIHTNYVSDGDAFIVYSPTDVRETNVVDIAFLSATTTEETSVVPYTFGFLSIDAGNDGYAYTGCALELVELPSYGNLPGERGVSTIISVETSSSKEITISGTMNIVSPNQYLLRVIKTNSGPGANQVIETAGGDVTLGEAQSLILAATTGPTSNQQTKHYAPDGTTVRIESTHDTTDRLTTTTTPSS